MGWRILEDPDIRVRPAAKFASMLGLPRLTGCDLVRFVLAFSQSRFGMNGDIALRHEVEHALYEEKLKLIPKQHLWYYLYLLKLKEISLNDHHQSFP